MWQGNTNRIETGMQRAGSSPAAYHIYANFYTLVIWCNLQN